MDHKDILQKPEDKENINKDSLYVWWKVPAGGKTYKNME